MDGPTTKTTGMNEALSRIARARGLPGLRITIGAKRTTGTRIAGGKNSKRTESIGRSAGENVIILRTHAKGHKTEKGDRVPARKVNFISKTESVKMTEVLNKAIRQTIQHRTPLATFIAAGTRIGELIIEAMKQHIIKSIAPRGRIKPVTERTRKDKEGETGKTGLPPLERSGQLLRSFKIDRVRILDK